jgi:hypothetical protein
MVKVRAKFRLASVLDQGFTKTLNFNAVGDNNKENSQFSKATPWGEIKIVVDNPDAVAQFTPGDEFYVDFIKA